MLNVNVPLGDCPSGWVLVDSRLEGNGRRSISSLLVKRRSAPGETERLLLPIMPGGRVYELIALPEDVTALVWQIPENGSFTREPRLTLRRIGRIKRALHMGRRVLRTYLRLPKEQRAESGLTLRKALLDLPAAYRAASGFRMQSTQWTYSEWTEHFNTLGDQEFRRIREHIARFPAHPHFRLLLVADAGGEVAVRFTLDSLRKQLYQNFSCVVIDLAGSLGAAFDLDAALKSAGVGSRTVAQHALPDWRVSINAELVGAREDEWVMLLRSGDALPPHSLYWFACEILRQPGVAIVYSDDDGIDADGRRVHPRFKPDWSLAHLRSTHYVGEAAVVRASAVAAAGGVSLDCVRHGNFDLLLRVIDSVGDSAGKVAHVPAVLFSRRESEDGGTEENGWWYNGALQAHLARNGIHAEVLETRPGYRRVCYRLPPRPPLVSVIVPTRDALPHLRRCMESLWEKTAYPRFEVLIVDNQSVNPPTLAYLDKIARRPGVRVLRYDRPFNFSAINNFAARHARGAVLCMLNNDTEVISPDWLDEMVGHLLGPGVGVAGAKLYYPDGHVQHGGVAVGPGGCADHLHLFIGRDDPGYCGRAMAAQELLAVTGACLLTWRDLYVQLGGLNQRRLTVAFNDVDYCLRVREAGYRVVWTPHAELVHHESVSRGIDRSWRRRMRARREVLTMRRRWGHLMRNDPFYNPNLSYDRPDFALSRAPRVRKPWE